MKQLIIFTLAACTLTSMPARADEDSEREALARISYELQRLQQSALDAGKDANTAARIKFHFDWLARDLELIRTGIDQHLDAPRQPRPAPPLKGDYRR
jgi:RAQPRD family integrative conjugative element protein